MVTLTRTSRGLAVSFADAVNIASRILEDGELSTDASDWNLVSVDNPAENVGVLTAVPLPDGSGVQVDVDFDFPNDYAGLYFVLRGRYEWKRNTTDAGIAVLHVGTTEPASFVDTDVGASEANTHYYYSVLALCGDSSGENPYHFEYNSVTGFATAFRYEDSGLAEVLQGRLPAEWFTEGSDITGLVQAAGLMLDSLRSHLDTYLRTANDVDNIQARHIDALASILNWTVDVSRPEVEQRRELDVAAALYRRKGRDAAIEFLVQATTGWDLSFEHGYRRMVEYAPEGPHLFDPTDTRRLALLDVPERRVFEQYVADGTGLGGQTIVCPELWSRDIHVEVGDDLEPWEEVDDFSSSGPDDKHYTVTGDSTVTLTFGNGTNGAVLPSGEPVYLTYYYGGDEYHYLPTGTTWRSPNGTRLVLDETPTSRPITPGALSRVQEVVRRFAASYAIYDFLISLRPVVESVPEPEDFVDFNAADFEYIYYLIHDTDDHALDTYPYVRA